MVNYITKALTYRLPVLELMNLKILNTVFQRINIIVFFIIIFTPSLWMICGHNTTISYTEKRTLSTFPSMPDNLSQIKSYFSGIDGYFNDHFGFREWMVYRYQRELKKRFPDVQRMSKVMKGLNNWYFFTGNSMLEDFTGRNLRSNDDLSEWIELYRAKKEWLKKQGIAYLLIVPPSKISIYGQFIGEPWIGQKGTTKLSQLKGVLQDSDSSTFLDLRPALAGRENDGDMLYFKTDTHWTPYGAYLAYLAIAGKIESLFTNIHFKRDFSFSKPVIRFCDKKENNCGDLTRMLLDYDSFTESYREVKHIPPCAEILPVDFELSNLDNSNEERAIRTHCPQKKLKAVIFRDSFFGSLIPYISVNFKEAIYIWKSFDQQNIEELPAEFKPDIVIEEIGERTL